MTRDVLFGRAYRAGLALGRRLRPRRDRIAAVARMWDDLLRELDRGVKDGMRSRC